MSIIKKGYRITVNSWENDSDNWQIITQDGYTKNQMQFIVDMLKLLEDDEVSNCYDPSEDQLNEIGEKVRDEIMVSIGTGTDVNEAMIDLGVILDLEDDNREVAYAYSYMMQPFIGSSEDWFLRTMDSYTIEYVPEDIEFQDVTNEF